ncbi:MAG: hypothetical protein A2020_09205 [Lentisphaerae bacterium GWF2_45_14]|nr:MAG: hypothetical protein A2020_09205 [Lentisphaerae bacterium GWF2_45_14]
MKRQAISVRRFLFFVLLTVGAFLLSVNHADAANVRVVTAFGKRYVYLRDIAAAYGLKTFVWKTKCGIYNKNNRFEFTFEKKEGSINKTKVYFLHAPYLRGYEPFISELDFLKVVEPILKARYIQTKKIRTIVIDPGHGAHDVGASGRIHDEKKLVLNIALKLKAALRAKGYIVYLTRDRDKFIPLEQRPYIASKYKADLFISLHANAAKNKSICGIESFALTPVGASSTQDSRINWRKEIGNTYDRQNSILTYEIQKAVIKRTGAFDRGVKRARFMVLKTPRCPAVLLEMGFMSNPSEEKLLGQNYYQQNMASAIAEGITKFDRR